MLNNGVKSDGVREVYEPISGDGRRPDEAAAAAGTFSLTLMVPQVLLVGLRATSHTPAPQAHPREVCARCCCCTSPHHRWLMSASKLGPVRCGATVFQRLPGR